MQILLYFSTWTWNIDYLSFLCLCVCVCVCIFLKFCAKSFQSCLTLCDPIECSLLPGSSTHGILESVILSFRGSSWPRDGTHISCGSCITGRFLLFGFIGSSLLPMGLLKLQRAGAAPRCSAWASHWGGFSCCRVQALDAQAPVVAARGLSSCGAWA